MTAELLFAPGSADDDAFAIYDDAKASFGEQLRVQHAGNEAGWQYHAEDVGHGVVFDNGQVDGNAHLLGDRTNEQIGDEGRPVSTTLCKALGSPDFGRGVL